MRLALILGWLGTSWAQNRPAPDGSAPPILESLREAHAQERALLALPVLQKYREDLLALERSSAEQRDYLTAALARDERHRAEAALVRLAPELTAPPAGSAVTLSAGQAAVSGGAAYDAGARALKGWDAAGASARWRLPLSLPAGGYEVIAEVACAPGSGGRARIKEDFHSLTRGITPTKGWEDFQRQRLGVLRLRHEAASLTLSAQEILGSGLFCLRSITLVPVGETTPDE